MDKKTFTFSRLISQLIIFGLAFFCTSSYAIIFIEGINLAYPQKEKVQVVFTSKRAFNYKSFSLKANTKYNKPERFVLDAFNTEPKFYLDDSYQRLFAKDLIIKNIRVGKNKRKDNRIYTRIVIDLRQPANIKVTEQRTATGNQQLILELTPKNSTTHVPTFTNQSKQLASKKSSRAPVIDDSEFYGQKRIPNQSNRKTATVSNSNKINKKNFVIAIDAGHGGRDPGASNKSIREKNITLAISQKLYKLLMADKQFKPFMTRKTDKLIALRDRVRMAHKKSADLFLSIHADSFPWSKSVRGASVYVLSNKKSSSQLARLLANKENSVDKLYGIVAKAATSDAQFSGRQLQVQATASASEVFAGILINRISKVKTVFDRAIHKGPFTVLRSTYFPSVLVEVGFLTNPSEAKSLAAPEQQQRIAKALYLSIKEYANKYLKNANTRQLVTPKKVVTIPTKQRNVPKNNSSIDILDRLKIPSKKETRHIVKQGETFLSIAKQYNIPESKLRAANRQYQEIIFPGDDLIIPK